jgi:hypothetical protein
VGERSPVAVRRGQITPAAAVVDGLSVAAHLDQTIRPPNQQAGRDEGLDSIARPVRDHERARVDLLGGPSLRPPCLIGPPA